MNSPLSDDGKFDITIAVGAFVALYWILYIDPLTGELLGLALGSLPVLAGVARYVEPEQYVSQTLVGLAAVALGGAAPATILNDTPAADWLVGSQPLPLALGWLLVVVILALVARRSLRTVITADGPAPT
ncbi:hypothetical protein [Halovenus halobia]|uniref:hypothetical protein n=1 Tax=Halovenus halobia TaxID=3396622 RepID=UPI003F547156